MGKEVKLGRRRRGAAEEGAASGQQSEEALDSPVELALFGGGQSPTHALAVE